MGTDSVNVGGRMVPSSEAGTAASQEANRIRNSGGGGGGGGGGGSCFPPDTKIGTPSGWTNIQDLAEGDLVWVPARNGTLQTREILKAKTYGYTDIYRIVGPGGDLLFRASASHSVRTLDGWKRVSDLDTNDTLISYDIFGTRVERPVTDRPQFCSREPVYNLVVDADFTFIVEGCFAHTFTNARSLQMAFWRVRSKLLGFSPVRWSKRRPNGRSGKQAPATAL